MPFIGKQPQTGAYSKLDAITTSATATYNLTLDGSAYYPQSANHLLVSLNGVMQAPQDSFTVSGSQITFASALTSSDSIDFIMALGDTLDIGVPSAGSVNTSQLANDAVTDAKIASGITASKLTGALPALDGSALTGIVTHSTAPAFYATISSDTALSAAAYTVAPLDTEEFDTHSFFNTSTYRFTPTIAGYYQFGMTFGTTSQQTHLLQVRKNGSGTGATLHYDFGSLRFTSNAATLISLNGSTDYVEFIVRTENSSTLRASDTRAYGYLVRTI